MANGNFFAALGLDPQLLTAGSCGGLVKAIFDKSRIVDGVLTMIAGALTANYFAIPVTQLAVSGKLFGMQIEVGQGVAGFFVGMFAVMIVGWLASMIRSKIEGEKKP